MDRRSSRHILHSLRLDDDAVGFKSKMECKKGHPVHARRYGSVRLIYCRTSRCSNVLAEEEFVIEV